jgi:hypothetical protein
MSKPFLSGNKTDEHSMETIRLGGAAKPNFCAWGKALFV